MLCSVFDFGDLFWYLFIVLYCPRLFCLCVVFFVTSFMSDCCMAELWTYEMIYVYIYICMYVCMYVCTDTATVSVIIRQYELQYCDWSLSCMCSLTTKLWKRCVLWLSSFFILQCLLESCQCYKARVFAVRHQHFQNAEKIAMVVENVESEMVICLET